MFFYYLGYLRVLAVIVEGYQFYRFPLFRSPKSWRGCCLWTPSTTRWESGVMSGLGLQCPIAGYHLVGYYCIGIPLGIAVA
jgi:hypothetical protein